MSTVDDTGDRINGVELNSDQMDTAQLTSDDTFNKVWLIRGYRVTLDGLLRAMIAALLIVTVLCAMLYAFYVIGLQSAQTAGFSTSCTSPECIQQAAFMLSCINTSADPCEDFYQFACGGFNQNHPRGGRLKHNTDHVFTDLTAARLRDLLETKWDSSATGKARRFFQECVHAKRDARDFTNDLIRLIGSYGGMDIIGSWDQADWNTDIVVRLLNTKHAVNPFFHVVQLPNEEYAMGYPNLPFAIDLRHATIFNHTRPEYRNSIAAVLSLLLDPNFHSMDRHVASTCNASCINQAAQEISDTEMEIMKRIVKSQGFISISSVDKYSRFDPEKIRIWGEQSLGEFDTHEVVSLENLTSIIDVINITALLQDMYGVDPSNQTIRVQIPSVQYMQDINELLTSQQRVIKQYLMWVLIREFIPILGPRYTELKNRVTDDLGFWDSAQYSQDTISEQCLSLLDRFMPSTISAILAQEHVGSHQIKQVEFFAKSAIDILEDYLNWLDKDYREQILDSLKNITVSHKQSATAIINIASLNKYYEDLELNDTGFFDIVKQLEEFIMKKTVRGEALTKTFEEYQREPLDLKMRYDYRSGKLFIPHALIQVPWYSHNLPAYVNAGGIGFQIYMSLLYQLLYSQDNLITGELYTDAHRDSLDQFKHRYSTCMIAAITEIFEQIQKEENPHGTIQQDIEIYSREFRALFVNLPELMSMQMSYRLHQRLESLQDQHLPGFERFTSDQMFFLAHTQTFCSNIKPSGYWDPMRTLQTINSLIVSGSREYQQTFNCVKKQRPFSHCYQL